LNRFFCSLALKGVVFFGLLPGCLFYVHSGDFWDGTDRSKFCDASFKLIRFFFFSENGSLRGRNSSLSPLSKIGLHTLRFFQVFPALGRPSNLPPRIQVCPLSGLFFVLFESFPHTPCSFPLRSLPSPRCLFEKCRFCLLLRAFSFLLCYQECNRYLNVGF